MNEKDYEKLYIEYGIHVEPLPYNYNPDDYGKRLMSTYQSNEGVLYSTSTSPDQPAFKESE